MSSFLNPVGPQSSQVYWRRRLVVGVALLAVLVIIFLIVFRPGGETPIVPDNTDDPNGTSTEAPPEEVACAPADILIEAVSDRSSYSSSQQPELSMTITNRGFLPCTLNVGSTQQKLVVTSGSETYWTSTDCQVDPVDDVRILQPSVPLQTSATTWDRTRSSASTCGDTNKPKVPAGGASYHLTVYVGDIKSEATKQMVLN
ncbi:MAG: hypothetical protein KF916_02995 [Microbacteriaceae bacterium]|nr:hypothetical protein [Microbacteriaceae bacterium]